MTEQENIKEEPSRTEADLRVKDSDFGELFKLCFPAERKWNQWYLSRPPAADSVRLGLYSESRLVAALELRRYRFRIRPGVEINASYIFGAMTHPSYRGRGFMKKLMKEALEYSRNRGDDLCVLIPADKSLYFFYGNLGFGSAFYFDEKRYVDIHQFGVQKDEREAYVQAQVDYSFFSSLEDTLHCGIIHNEEQFGELRAEMAQTGGMIEGIVSADGMPVALAAYISKGEELRVRLLLARSEEAAEALLGLIKSRHPNVSTVVEDLPSDRKAMLRVRGMARIICPERFFGEYCRQVREIKQVIRLRDSLMPENSGVYRLENGECTVLGATENIRPTLDTDVGTLTSIIFSSEEMGKIFNLPTRRPFIALMLD